MFIKFLKPTIFTIAASTLTLTSINIANAKPSLCNPKVTIPTRCSDCHVGNPSVATYIKNACATVLARQQQPVVVTPPMNNGGNNNGGNNNGGNNNGGNNNNGGHGNNKNGGNNNGGKDGDGGDD